MSKRGQGTPKGRQTNERIVHAAEELITERGCTDFQMIEVAERCGMTKGALYYYYADKNDLVEEVLDRTLEGFLEQLEDICEQGRSPRENLHEYCRAFAAEVAQGGPVVVSMVQDLAGGPDALTRMGSRLSKVTSFIEGRLELARDAGAVRCDFDTGIAASGICGVLLFAAFKALRTYGQAFDEEHFANELIELIDHGIGV